MMSNVADLFIRGQLGPVGERVNVIPDICYTL